MHFTRLIVSRLFLEAACGLFLLTSCSGGGGFETAVCDFEIGTCGECTRTIGDWPETVWSVEEFLDEAPELLDQDVLVRGWLLRSGFFERNGNCDSSGWCYILREAEPGGPSHSVPPPSISLASSEGDFYRFEGTQVLLCGKVHFHHEETTWGHWSGPVWYLNVSAIGRASR